MRKLRLVFTGFPCAPEPWRAFLPGDMRNDIVPFSHVLNDTSRLTLSAMASIVATEIATRKPSTIVCHDFGGPCTLLAVSQLAKRSSLPPCKVVVFNTALRDFDVLVNRHPWSMQLTSYERFKKTCVEHGTVADPAYATMMPRVRALYRRVILASLVEHFMALPKIRFSLGVPALFLRSNNDRFIAHKSLDALAEDVPFTKVIEIDYGHFPHSHPNAHQLRQALVEFEAS